MKYMLLIHQGDTPTPGSPEWERLSEDEQQAVYADYQAINQTPGVTPGSWMEPPETAVDLALLVRAVLGEATVEDHGQQEFPLAGLRRDRDQAAITDERPNDLLLVGKAA